ncbi:MAG: adenosine kinase [Paludibacteraceae bacterium]|nr:adenosine kinase [Paludibacteraceae bacterium]
MAKKILGIGNALTDMLCVLDSDDILSSAGLPKGSMQLVDKDVQMGLLKNLEGRDVKKARGGSVPNTIAGIQQLGLQTGFVGRVGNDAVGDFFEGDLKGIGVNSMIVRDANLPTGTCLSLISPDGERTMATCLGATGQFAANEIKPEMFEGYGICHIDGYLLQNHELIEKAMELAHQAGVLISLDLGSYNVVADNLDFLQRVIPQYANVVFANEEESKAYTNKEPEEALEILASQVDYAIVKVGSKGSFIKHNGEKVFVKPLPNCNCIDTTGAGDLYASGFLYGLANDKNIAECGRIGALVSGNVVEVVGTTIDATRWNNIKANL